MEKLTVYSFLLSTALKQSDYWVMFDIHQADNLHPQFEAILQKKEKSSGSIKREQTPKHN